MLTFNYQYRIYPDRSQEKKLLEIMEVCRSAYNYALREIKDWCNSRKCSIDRCSLVSEYIIPADAKFPSELNQLNQLPKAKKEFPRLKADATDLEVSSKSHAHQVEVPSQVLQQTIKQLHRAWDFFRARGYGFPRFKKRGQFKSILFPQFKENPIIGWQINLPKIGKVSGTPPFKGGACADRLPRSESMFTVQSQRDSRLNRFESSEKQTDGMFQFVFN